LIQQLEGARIAGLNIYRNSKFRDVTSSVMLILLHGHICRVRTSSGMFLRRRQDKIIQAIEKRIADYTFIPVGT